MACALRSMPNPPSVTFLVSYERRLREFDRAGRRLWYFPMERSMLPPESKLNCVKGSTRVLALMSCQILVLSTNFQLDYDNQVKVCANALGHIKQRLSKESTVLVSCPGVGIMKKIFQTHFQDPMSRPTFCRGISGQGVWTVSGSAKEHRDDFASMLKLIRKRELGFKVALSGIGLGLAIGPPMLQDSIEGPQNIEARKSRSRYLISTLLRAPFLRAHEPHSNVLLLLSFKKLMSASIMGPMAVMMECPYAKLFADEAAQKLGSALIFEAWSVLRQHLPNLQLRQASDWVTEEAAKQGEQLHPMLLEVLSGIDTDIDDLNGWVIDEAHHFGIPCDHHEGMMAMVKAKGEKIKKEIAAMEAAKCESSQSQRDGSRPRESERLAEPLDKLELKRMKKAENQRKKLGHQEMPDYATPNIQPLGKRAK